MAESEPSIGELIDSIVRAGTEAGYRIGRDSAGRLQVTATASSPMDPPLTFRFTGQQLRDYYTSAAADTGKSGGAGTPWETWMLSMSTHLGEAVYKAGTTAGPSEIVIYEGRFWIEPAQPRSPASADGRRAV
ncbi:MAG: hypothetical protein HOQ36_25520 [Nocardia sp.]|nr:hypothetical protein [Nocardia sp.]